MTDLRKVDVNLIVVLHAVLTERNLTRAGESIGMSQPAVSGALARLRQQFDDALLVRDGRTFVLTKKAIEIKPIVDEAIVEIQRTLEVLPTFDPATSTRTFFISASDYVLSEITAPLYHLLSQYAPGTRVEFEALPVNERIGAIDLLRRDVFISATGRGVPGQRQSLFSDRFVALVDANNHRLRDNTLSMQDLIEMRHIRSTFGPHVMTHIDDMLTNAGITPHIGLSVRGFLAVPFMLHGTELVGFAPERVAKRFAASAGLTIAATPLKPPLLVEAAHWHPSKTDDQAIRWLVTMLRSAAEIIEDDDEAGTYPSLNVAGGAYAD